MSIDADSNSIIVGPEEKLRASALRAGQVCFVGDWPDGPLEVEAKVRYRSPATRARVHTCGTDLQVEFHAPQRAITPGQAVVFYRGEEVVGGGIIEATWTGCRHSTEKTKSGPWDTG